MKIRSAGRLLIVAVVTSAAVAQIRVHMLPPSQTDVPVQTSTRASQSHRLPSCIDGRDGMLRAACDARDTRRPVDNGDRPINRIDMPRTGKLWV